MPRYLSVQEMLRRLVHAYKEAWVVTEATSTVLQNYSVQQNVEIRLAHTRLGRARTRSATGQYRSNAGHRGYSRPNEINRNGGNVVALAGVRTTYPWSFVATPIDATLKLVQRLALPDRSALR